MESFLFALLTAIVMSNPQPNCSTDGATCCGPLAESQMTQSYEVDYVAGQPAIIAVYTEADVDLYVFNPEGLLVGSDNGMHGETAVYFLPEETGTYEVQVVNHTPDDDYTISFE